MKYCRRRRRNMSKHDDQVSLKDMLSHAREAVDLLGGSIREELAANRVLQLALTQLVEIIGEAANRMSQPTQSRHPEIPWLQIIGMRNRLVHGYDVIDFDLLWDTITTDLPPLIDALQEIVEDA
ncbi:hypothetical protein CLG94_11600 [Candidatus Methylomirabilis limnetica]|uniref:DUF86 domain-containing protein n=2 Tax=Candidatus Methylomirabilis limnetica TaxID=2033718 RepID=A0A2T4TVI6_9BACT|nr:hypothetical protein CLG94_11600 [Candidatus Methylomirabilis limnetica]